MKEIKQLSLEEKKKFKAAIERGYFDDYDADPRAWRHTFTGAYIWQNPGRIKTIARFEELLGHVPTWADITDLTLEDFVLEMKESMAANTCKVVFAEIKSVINRHIYEVEIPSRRYSQILTVRAEPSQAVYLNEEEVERIHQYPPMSDIEQYVKKIFLIEAYTGARNCDSVRLTIENCDQQTNLLTYVSQKTKTQITVPVHRNLIQYLRDPLKLDICLDTFNTTLRRICRHCLICDKMTIFRRGEETTAEKWRFISSHTGRRSFATNLYRRKADPALIANYMGHSSPDITMKRYIIGYIEASNEVMNFFK